MPLMIENPQNVVLPQQIGEIILRTTNYRANLSYSPLSLELLFPTTIMVSYAAPTIGPAYD